MLPVITIPAALAGPGLRDPVFPGSPAQGSPMLSALVQMLALRTALEPASASPSGTAVVIPMDEWFMSRLAHAGALWTALQRDRWLDPFEPSAARRHRLILGLRSLDGRDRGASYRDLARALYGADRIPAGASWKSHDMRSRIMRLVTDANALRTQNYLSLIRPKR